MIPQWTPYVNQAPGYLRKSWIKGNGYGSPKRFWEYADSYELSALGKYQAGSSI